VGPGWGNFYIQVKTALECCKKCLMGNSGGSQEEQKAQKNQRKDCNDEVSNGNEDSNWKLD
jgi:hypothetical protein